MSRAFVKEDDSGEPPIIPPRPALPAGTANYVTPQGLSRLRTELTELELEIARTQSGAVNQHEADQRRQLLILNGRLSDLTARIASARLIDPQTQPADQVRFGATVTLRTHSPARAAALRQFTIVGVDEASVADGRISFVSPLARSVLGTKVGQTIRLRIGGMEEEAEVTDISYR